MFSVDFLCCAFLDFPVSRSFSMPNEGGGRPALHFQGTEAWNYILVGWKIPGISSVSRRWFHFKSICLFSLLLFGGDESILTNIMLSSLFHGLKPPPRFRTAQTRNYDSNCCVRLTFEAFSAKAKPA